jgi:hypothetical protein
MNTNPHLDTIDHLHEDSVARIKTLRELDDKRHQAQLNREQAKTRQKRIELELIGEGLIQGKNEKERADVLQDVLPQQAGYNEALELEELADHELRTLTADIDENDRMVKLNVATLHAIGRAG